MGKTALIVFAFVAGITVHAENLPNRVLIPLETGDVKPTASLHGRVKTGVVGGEPTIRLSLGKDVAFRAADVVIEYDPAVAKSKVGESWVRAAANDLSAAIKKTCGKEPLVCKKGSLRADWQGPVIHFVQASAADGLRRVDWHIKTEPGHAWLFATSGMSANSAGVDFTERFLSLLYVTPDAKGDPFTFDPERTIPVVDYTVRPAIACGYAFLKTPGDAYMRRRRLDYTDELEERLRVSDEVRDLKGKSRYCHTFFMHLPPEKYFKDHPEWYSLVDGRRQVNPVGQICLSNREAREECLRNLLKTIAEDRRKNPGEHPTIYDFTQMDDIRYLCACDRCRAICAKYNRKPGGWTEGGDAGLNLEFVNYLATEVTKKYPDVTLRTFAYDSTETPPKHGTIVPAKNVLVWWCDLFTRCEHNQPLIASELNANRLRNLREWVDIARVEVWDYMLQPGGLYGGDYPEWCGEAIFSDAKLFRSLGIERVFMESEGDPLFLQPFHSLNSYLLSRAYVDPDLDLEKVTKEYCRVYGMGADDMYRALDFLRVQIRRNPVKTIVDWRNRVLPWQTVETMEAFRLYVRAALAKEPRGSYAHALIVRALASVDRSLIDIYAKIAKGAERRKMFKNEYAKSVREYAEDIPMPDEKRTELKKTVEDALGVMDLRFKDMPEGIKGIPETEFFCVDTHYAGDYVNGLIKDDPESETGRALTWKLGLDTSLHAKFPVPCGIYDNEKKAGANFSVSAEQAGTSEAYHWVKVGRGKLGRNTIFWMPGDWNMSFSLKNFYRNPEGQAVDPNWYDVWISVKFTGPAYVPNSRKPNGIFVDRIVLRNSPQK